MDPQFVWAGGHFLLLTSFIRIVYAYTIGIFSKTIPTFWYRTAYTGALVSYAIVIYKTLGKPSLNAAYWQKAMLTDNFQYGLVALYWSFTKPVYLSLLPFATFSLFHCMTFTRTTLLPKFFKAPPAAPAGVNGAAPRPAATNPTLERYTGMINAFEKKNFAPAMHFVAYSELAILVWVFVKAILRQSTFLAPLFLLLFIRMRYVTSVYTRDAVKSFTAYVDRLVVNAPPPVRNGWETVKGLGNNFARSIMADQPGSQGSRGSGATGSAGRSTGTQAGQGAAGAGAAGLRDRTGGAAPGRR